MRRLFKIVCFLICASCVSTRLKSVDDSIEAAPVVRALRSWRCDLARERIFRASFFSNDQLLLIADLESGGKYEGARASDSTLILRGEAMEELLKIVVGPDLTPLAGPEIEWSGRPVKIERTAVFFDGRRIPLGPGELTCLMGGRLPAHWLSSKKLQWNWGEKSVQLDDGSRLVSISMVGEQLAGINITWSSGWFSKSRIRVTMTQSNTAAVYGGESVSGKLEAPLGYNLRWTEI